MTISHLPFLSVKKRTDGKGASYGHTTMAGWVHDELGRNWTRFPETEVAMTSQKANVSTAHLESLQENYFNWLYKYTP